ncbi:MAG: SH3 domain-containing protein [Lachnospiraceae bacterium]|nr:SH3 domain-containing protein [Lachnospiraceae bacterium]
MRENNSMVSRVRKAAKNGVRRILPILLLFFIFMLTGCGSKTDTETTTGTESASQMQQTDASLKPAGTDDAVIDITIGSDPTGEASPYLDTKAPQGSEPSTEDATKSSTEETTAPPESKPEETTPEETKPEETTAPEKIIAFENCNELVYATPRMTLLNFRNKPSTSGKVLAQIPAGTPLQRTGRSDEWSRVIYDGQEGYVSANFVSTEAPIIDLFGEKAQVCDEEYYTTDKLNFREKPSKDGTVIKILDRAVKVRVTAFGENWSRIVIGDQEGYVASQFLSKEEPAPLETQAPPAETDPQPPIIDNPNEAGFTDCDEQIRVTTNLRMREGPNAVANVITILNKGTEVLCTGKNAEWARINYNGRTGYVSLAYVTTVGGAGTEQPAQPVTSWTVGKITKKVTENGTLYTGNGGPLIAIDAGHQAKGNSETEPNGPGSATMKAKVSTGTSGRATGLAESMLNLVVSIQLKDALLARGYNVLMIREDQNVDISNMQRAQRANAAGAAVMVRVHANGSNDANKTGAETLAPSNKNPYLSADIIASSQWLSKCVIDAFCAATGAKNNNIYYTDTMTGINFSTIPTTTIEMGYMTNHAEDANMASPEYQVKMVVGIMNGLDTYFGR